MSETRSVVSQAEAKVISQYGRDVRIEWGKSSGIEMSATAARDLADLLYAAANRCEGRS